jgi:hypothetical protein
MSTRLPQEDPRRLPRLPDPARVQRIASDAEAIASANLLAAEFAPGASERDRQRILPWDELDRWSESGLGAITVPRQYGGADVSYATLAEVFVILCAADPALGQFPQNDFGVLREIGSEECASARTSSTSISVRAWKKPRRPDHPFTPSDQEIAMTLTLQHALNDPPWEDQPRPATPGGWLARAWLAVARGAPTGRGARQDRPIRGRNHPHRGRKSNPATPKQR